MMNYNTTETVGWNSYQVSGIPNVVYYNKFKTFTMIDHIMISGVIPKVISNNIKLYSRNIKLICLRIGRTFNWNIKIVHNDKTLLDRNTDQYLTRDSDRSSYYAMEKKIVQCLDLEVDNLIKRGRL